MRKWGLWLVWVGLSMILTIFGSRYLGFLTGFVDRITLPVRQDIWGWATYFLGDSSETNKLRAELAEAQFNIAQLGKLTEENAALRKQLKVNELRARQQIPATVVGSGQGIARLDQGSGAGTRKGMAVLSGSVMVGKIAVVNEWGSSMNLPNSPDFRLAVWVRGVVSGSKRAEGLVMGRAGQVWLTRVLLDEDIAEGDVVVTSGGEGEPGGMLLGTVAKINKGEVYQEAQVEPAVNYEDLGEVFVVGD